MNLLEKYITGINSGNAATLAEVFAEETIFDDEGTKKIFGKSTHLTSRKAIRRSFRFIMPFKPKATILSMEGSVMEYDVVVLWIKMELRGTLIKEENGLIKEYVCKLR